MARGTLAVVLGISLFVTTFWAQAQNARQPRIGVLTSGIRD
jgi:hypothetical protein